MNTHLSYNDQAIQGPSEDRFGVNPFARALAVSICKMQTPQGSVIGLNGPWGCGKSSAVNLCKHHLAPSVESGEIAIIDFACWWFRGEDGLALAFFRTLYAGLSPSLGAQAMKKLPKLGARLLRAGGLVGKVAEATGAMGAGGIAEKGMEWLAGLIETEETVETLHADLSKALRDQKKRFLIVIDDIDRLAPDEALLMFRLVKSVGRLPNVMYLLVYDRTLAERIVSQAYPSEGPHYLEKIVQASFELPEPSKLDLQQHLMTLIESICGEPEEGARDRFMNHFYDGIASSMRTPRDVARYANSLSVAWPAVAGEVDLGDFLTLEMLRLLHPDVYRAIRQNKDALCGTGRFDGHRRETASKRLTEQFFGAAARPSHEVQQRILMRLFPALENVWSNISYGEGSVQQWARSRRVCAPAHFDTYFRFTVSDESLSKAELDTFIAQASDSDFVKFTLQQALTVPLRSGGTKASVWLDELGTHADRVAADQISALLTSLFEIADKLDAQAGSYRGSASNALRLRWLCRGLTERRLSLDERSAVFRRACDTASLSWLVDFSWFASREHQPRDGTMPEPIEKRLTTARDAEVLSTMSLDRIRVAAADGTLLTHQDLSSLLFRWLELAQDGGVEARAWVAQAVTQDEGVLHLTRAFTSYSWTQNIGLSGLADAVAKRITRVNPVSLEKLVDLAGFRARVEAVAAAGRWPDVQDFLHAWERAEAGARD